MQEDKFEVRLEPGIQTAHGKWFISFVERTPGIGSGWDVRHTHPFETKAEAEAHYSKIREIVQAALEEQAQKPTNPPSNGEYLYAYASGGRKVWYLGDVFKGWEEVDSKRGNYFEHFTFRKPLKDATADDRQLARDYGTPFDHDPE